MTRFSILIISLFMLSISFGRPTSNVINAVYSLQDEFFEDYGFPAMSFKERVTICENPYKSLLFNNDSTIINAQRVWDKYTMMFFMEKEGQDDVDFLYFKLIRDKVKKRHLLMVFHQVQGNYEMRLIRVDVIQYDKKAQDRWKTINAADIFPKLTWHDLYQGISDKAFNKIFTMRPAISVVFDTDGSMSVDIVYDYIEGELKEVQEYLENNPVDANSIQLIWNKEKSKYIAKII